MPRRVPPPLSVTLTWLREAAAWPQKELAGAAHVHPNHLSDYEKGLRPLSRKRLTQLAHFMGYDDSAIDLALLAVKAISLPKESDDDGEKKRAFDRLSVAERRLAKQGATRLGLVVTDLAEARFLEMARSRCVAAARERAGQLWERLAKLGIAERRSLIERSRIFRLWAVSERVAEESAKAAPRDAESVPFHHRDRPYSRSCSVRRSAQGWCTQRRRWGRRCSQFCPEHCPPRFCQARSRHCP